MYAKLWRRIVFTANGHGQRIGRPSERPAWQGAHRLRGDAATNSSGWPQDEQPGRRIGRVLVGRMVVGAIVALLSAFRVICSQPVTGGIDQWHHGALAHTRPVPDRNGGDRVALIARAVLKFP